VNRLESEACASRQGRLADYLTRLDFVVLDELRYLPFAQTGGQLLFHLVSRLYERTSAFGEWPRSHRLRLRGIAASLTGAAIRCSTFVFNSGRKSGSSRPSPPTSVCLHIFLLPDAIDVATHVERLSSKETNKAAHLFADKGRCRQGTLLCWPNRTPATLRLSASGQTQPFAES
jgi:IstB-like ATP binding protein